MRVVITYGTFDVLHYGHFHHLKESKKLGDFLIVGLSTNDFNEIKGKKALYSYEQRYEMISSLKYVDLIIPEESWEQKIDDIKKYKVSILSMGNDWENNANFNYLSEFCKLHFTNGAKDLNRISSSKIRTGLQMLEKVKVDSKID